MRIAFDLDDTLFGQKFPLEPAPRGLLARVTYHERLRIGTVGLLDVLNRMGHEVWIYTTSLRSPTAVRRTFWLHGARVRRIINQKHHAAKRAILGEAFWTVSKYPPAWNIDVLIDDSELVLQESRRFGFKVIQILPTDANWTTIVFDELDTAMREAA